jgi:hypothetical protein
MSTDGSREIVVVVDRRTWSRVAPERPEPLDEEQIAAVQRRWAVEIADLDA